MAPVPNGLNIVGGKLPEHRLPGARAPWIQAAKSSPGVNWRSTQDITEWVNDPENKKALPDGVSAVRMPSYDEISAVVKTREGRSALRAADGYDMRSNRGGLYGPNSEGFSGKDFVVKDKGEEFVVEGQVWKEMGRLVEEARTTHKDEPPVIREGERPIIVWDSQAADGSFNVKLTGPLERQVLEVYNMAALSAVPLPKDGVLLTASQKIQWLNAHDDWELYLNILNGNNFGSAGRVVCYHGGFNGHDAFLVRPLSGLGVWFVAAKPQKLVVAVEPLAPVVVAGASASEKASASDQTASGLVIPGAEETLRALQALGVPAREAFDLVKDRVSDAIAGPLGNLLDALEGKQ